MGHGHKFDVKKLERLRDPARLSYLNPDKIWAVIGDDGMKTVIDLGAGIGFFAIPFSRKLSAGVLYACDLSAEMIAHLNEALRHEGVGNVVAVKTGEVEVPLDDGIADLVFMVNLHHEFDQPLQSLRECRRLLRPGGRIAVIDWAPVDSPSGPPRHVRFEPETVRDQLRGVGFEDVQSHSLLPYHFVITSRTAETEDN
ncbi:MAG: class I SAM-dependent methyltransferase [SAR324 cluster bacterium]|nr:class I SAM-dependent methyltransferase [SAR324 cluster bacterium]